MDPVWLFVAVLLPLVSGALLYFLRPGDDRRIHIFTGAATLVTAAFVWALILLCPQGRFRLISFAKDLDVAFRFDGLGRFFAGIVATLWPLTVLYAFSYMEGEPRRGTFFAFFTMSFGVTLGICMADNLFTLYLFYELLTLITVPLVIHTMTQKAVKAAWTYLIFSIGGAAFAFAAMVYLIVVGAGGSFALGGVFKAVAPSAQGLARVFYLLGFLGFGVKSAIFPLHIWLPRASVAPTPVTALLHAVAVVKAGVFAVTRLTWFCFDPSFLAGTWVQWVTLGFAAFTMVYGSTMAVKQVHFKLRLAYSTVSNLSYVLFGVCLLTPEGLSAGLLHMAFHANIKILAFFCAGAVLCRTGRAYVTELNGLGRRMPVTFACYTLAALSLTGIPPLSGFVSKWQLLTAAARAGTPAAYVGAGALLVSALLTAIYMLTVVCRAWFPARGEDKGLAAVKEADWRMCVPLVILALGTVCTGLYAQGIVDVTRQIAGLG